MIDQKKIHRPMATPGSPAVAGLIPYDGDPVRDLDARLSWYTERIMRLAHADDAPGPGEDGVRMLEDDEVPESIVQRVIPGDDELNRWILHENGVTDAEILQLSPRELDDEVNDRMDDGRIDNAFWTTPADD